MMYLYTHTFLFCVLERMRLMVEANEAQRRRKGLQATGEWSTKDRGSLPNYIHNRSCASLQAFVFTICKVFLMLGKDTK